MSTIFSKVLYIGPTSDFGGMGAVLNMYAKNIQDIKIVSTLNTVKNASKIGSLLNVVFQVNKKLITDKDIKLLHIHSASKKSFYRKVLLALLGKLYQKKVIFHIHSGSFDQFYKNAGYLKPGIKVFLQKMDMIICLSNEWKVFYSQKMGLKKVVVIGNPIEIHQLNISQFDNRILHLLFLGKICDEKGIFDLLNFLSNNKFFLNNQIRLTIGGIDQEERLNKLLANPIFSTKVKFIGWVTYPLKSKHFLGCDVFILPSYFEGLPVSILEAMSFGKPVIATDVGGIPSIVKEGYNGWLFDAGVFDQLDPILEEIFLNKGILTQFGSNSHNTAKQFSTSVIKAQLSQLYLSMINNNV
jgi:glycosyltransferase involved in cell wall biosynthesis